MSTPRTLVIGDIHGCVDEVDRLLDAVVPTTADTLIFLGDYIDRGPASKAVIDRMIRLQHEGPRCVFLKGNHEDMFLSFLGLAGLYGEVFLQNGGGPTLRSYGLDGQHGDAAAARLPDTHLAFLQSLHLTYQHDNFLCVHAGLLPTRPLELQRTEDLLWIREEWTRSSHPFPFTVLFGHTPRREVLFDLPYKIGLDTGLVYWNKLSCLDVVDACLYQIRRGEHAVQRTGVRTSLTDVAANRHGHPGVR